MERILLEFALFILGESGSGRILLFAKGMGIITKNAYDCLTLPSYEEIRKEFVLTYGDCY